MAADRLADACRKSDPSGDGEREVVVTARAQPPATGQMAAFVATASDKLKEHLPEALKEHSKLLVVVGGGFVTLTAIKYFGKSFYRTNPFAFGRTGALQKDKIDDSITGYNSFFSQKDGKGIELNRKMSTPEFVDKFYRRVDALVLFPAVKH